jgi:hypothetical protein
MACAGHPPSLSHTWAKLVVEGRGLAGSWWPLWHCAHCFLLLFWVFFIRIILVSFLGNQCSFHWHRRSGNLVSEVVSHHCDTSKSLLTAFFHLAFKEFSFYYLLEFKSKSIPESLHIGNKVSSLCSWIKVKVYSFWRWWRKKVNFDLKKSEIYLLVDLRSILYNLVYL